MVLLRRVPRHTPHGIIKLEYVKSLRNGLPIRSITMASSISSIDIALSTVSSSSIATVSTVSPSSSSSSNSSSSSSIPTTTPPNKVPNKQLTLLLLHHKDKVLLGMKKRGFGAGKVSFTIDVENAY